MIRTLLLLIICAYNIGCLADTSIPVLGPEQKPVKLKINPRLIKSTPIIRKKLKERPRQVPTFKLTTKKTTPKTSKKAAVTRPPVMRYKAPNLARIHAEKRRLAVARNDAIQYGHLSHALTIYNDPKSTENQKALAAAEIVDRTQRIQTPEKKALARSRLAKHVNPLTGSPLSLESLQKEAISGKALIRIKEHAAGAIKAGRDPKTDPNVTAEMTKLTDYDKQVADRHLKNLRK